jgi:hypothetical protein
MQKIVNLHSDTKKLKSFTGLDCSRSYSTRCRPEMLSTPTIPWSLFKDVCGFNTPEESILTPVREYILLTFCDW